MIVYSAQGINDPVTSAMHIIFGECSFITLIFRSTILREWTLCHYFCDLAFNFENNFLFPSLAKSSLPSSY